MAIACYAVAIGSALYSDLLSLEVLLVAVVAYAYFALVGLFVYRTSDIVRDGRLTKPALVLLLSFAYVLLPAVVFPSPQCVPIQVIGWEMILSAYSYGNDTAKTKQPRSLSECLFFLLVNPTLVFSERGRRVAEPNVNRSAVARCLLGITGIGGYFGLFAAISAFISSRIDEPETASPIFEYYRFVLTYGAYSAMNYFGQSGRASLEIGMMKLLGWHVPERYHYPFLATGPDAFWRRWNIYIGSWARRYIFFPFGLYAKRRARHLPMVVIKAAAVTVTFTAIGFAHDFSRFAARDFTWSHNWLVAFVFFATMLLIWMGLSASIGSFWANSNKSRKRFYQPIVGFVSWLIFMQLLLIMGWIAYSDLSGGIFARCR
ncbi:MAG: hypothetical protein JXA30_12130 [Deltaproteobacteria bacterium]|nr:hypothetical protein [Deltaproteobacteria bacterium]